MLDANSVPMGTLEGPFPLGFKIRTLPLTLLDHDISKTEVSFVNTPMPGSCCFFFFIIAMNIPDYFTISVFLVI